MEPMYPLSKLYELGIIPEEFRGLLPEKCSDPNCGYPLISNKALTRKRCLNIHCPGHMQFRAAETLAYLGVTGIAEKTCYKWIVQNKFTHHLQVIPLVFKSKPKLELWQVAKLCFTPDISDEWNKYLAGKSEILEGDLPANLMCYKADIVYAMQFFEIKKYTRKIETWHIAIHGGLGEFGDRSQFPTLCNDLKESLIYTIAHSSVTNSCSHLVTYQPQDTSARKVRKALDNKIIICSPDEYIIRMAIRSQQLLEK